MPKNNLKHHSEETKLKIKESMRKTSKILGCPIGTKRSLETRSMISQSLLTKNMARFGTQNGNWKGGTKRGMETGYRLIWCPNHPFASKRGHIKEHRFVMEKHLGRFLLNSEIVHHIDGNKKNNSIENLMLFNSREEHKKFHYEMEKIGMRIYAELRKKQSNSQHNNPNIGSK